VSRRPDRRRQRRSTINGRDGSPRRLRRLGLAAEAAGISTIDGRIIGDDRAFDAEGPGKELGVGLPRRRRCAAKVSALQCSEDLVGVAIRPGAAVGAPASIEIRPGGSGLTVENAVITSAAGGRAEVDARRLPGSGRLRISGTVPLGSGETSMTASVDAPAQFFLQECHDTLVGEGVLISNGPILWRQAAAPPALERAQFLFAHRSPSLSEIAVTLMKVSQNLYAETLLRALGAGTGDGSARAGQDVVRDVLTGWGVPADAYVLADGSGLSRYNYVTADTIASVLKRMATDPRHAARFEATLPIVGKDGTLARRMRGTLAENNVKAKTGSISNVRALSGYVTTRMASGSSSRSSPTTSTRPRPSMRQSTPPSCACGFRGGKGGGREGDSFGPVMPPSPTLRPAGFPARPRQAACLCEAGFLLPCQSARGAPPAWRGSNRRSFIPRSLPAQAPRPRRDLVAWIRGDGNSHCFQPVRVPSLETSITCVAADPSARAPAPGFEPASQPCCALIVAGPCSPPGPARSPPEVPRVKPTCGCSRLRCRGDGGTPEAPCSRTETRDAGRHGASPTTRRQ
jgi:PBP4 family serine-type D-alanyl-D-alanine carboxypeptidase